MRKSRVLQSTHRCRANLPPRLPSPTLPCPHPLSFPSTAPPLSNGACERKLSSRTKRTVACRNPIWKLISQQANHKQPVSLKACYVRGLAEGAEVVHDMVATNLAPRSSRRHQAREMISIALRDLGSSKERGIKKGRYNRCDGCEAKGV